MSGARHPCNQSFQSSAAPKDGCYKHAQKYSCQVNGFQSSAAPKDGCYDPRCRRLPPTLQRFNPQPPRRTAATGKAVAASLPGVVSILSRPEGRLLQLKRQQKPEQTQVSILSRPEGRLLPSNRGIAARRVNVSILSRPEGRLLLHRKRTSFNAAHWFQSSAAPKDGCYSRRLTMRCCQCCFNPQPPRRTAATSCRPRSGSRAWSVSILSRPEGRLLPVLSGRDGVLGRVFQSSAAPKDGCYWGVRQVNHWTSSKFQSSAAPKDGCYSGGV